MRTLRDPTNRLGLGLEQIREEFDVPAGFPPEVLRAAQEAAGRTPDEHADWRAMPFVTLDPATSTDLDQAFAIERSGTDLLLHYAIADVAWFVHDGDAMDAEAWKRGTTCYLPDGKASLYPPILCEGAASLLADVDRPAIVLSVRVDPAGSARLDGVERAIVRSRAKLAYETATEDDLPAGFVDLTDRLVRAEDNRGAARVDPPEQELEEDGAGGFVLRFRPRRTAEERNAALSLAANLAVAQAMIEARTGLFRVMAPPDAGAQDKLRAEARALGLNWPADMPLTQFERRLDPALPPEAAFMLAIRRAGTGASYQPWTPGETPWHAAIAAPYAHATAPLRRLADRYVLRTVLALAQGGAVPDPVGAALPRLPKVMGRASSRDSRVDRAVIDLAEAVMLSRFAGCTFRAEVIETRDTKATFQIDGLPVIARADAPGVLPGASITVQLEHVDVASRTLDFAFAPPSKGNATT